MINVLVIWPKTRARIGKLEPCITANRRPMTIKTMSERLAHLNWNV